MTDLRNRLTKVAAALASAMAVCLAMMVVLTDVRGQDAPSPNTNDFKHLAARIDRHLAEGWRTAKVEPAALADDAEFLRRVSLDLAGQIPSVAEVRAFLNDPAPDKRQRLVQRLLDSPRYVTHFTSYWRALLLPEANTNLQARYLAPGFEGWIRKQLTTSAGYDKMVHDLLTAPVDLQMYRRTGGVAESNPLAFYLAKELKPENLAGGVSRLFLGVRLECAQCHDHPFGDWKRDQFWSFAAFFAGVEGKNQGDFINTGKERLDKREINIAGTERVAQASYLDGSQPQWKYNVSPRKTMADWVTAPANPYFARTAANRLWSYFFGAGLVEPVDEMAGAGAGASHPALLDELASDFAAHGFDVKYLIRAITASRAYQLTSAGKTTKSDEDVRRFERMPVRGLSPEQLFDSIVQATGHREPAANSRAIFFPGNNSVRGEFLSLFTEQSARPTDVQTSIPQALLLLNGKLIGGATNLEQSETLAAVADAPFMDTEQRIETLYLATLSRLPRPRELARLVTHVDRTRPEDRNIALADVLWALLNSAEFMLNH